MQEKTYRIWISNQPEGINHDATRAYYDDVARRSELCDCITVSEDDERGILLTGPEEDMDLLLNQLDALLRHDPSGDDDRPVRFTADPVEPGDA